MAIAFSSICSLLFITFNVLSTLLFTINTVTVASTKVPKRLVLNLIHRDSIHSPYYSPNENVADQAKRDVKSSIERLAYLRAKVKGTLGIKDCQTNLLPGLSGALFFVNFSIGQPPIPQVAIMDTGHSFLWVQCHPYVQVGPLLDPSVSSTFSNVSCNSPSCQSAPNKGCNSVNQCTYEITYASGDVTSGTVGTEQLTFQTSDDGTIVVPNVVFGCGHENLWPDDYDERCAGVFGLGLEATSLITRFGSKFSYCIGNLNDLSHSYNKLLLGDGADIEGYSTPLDVVDGLYHLTLEGISVGEKMLNIDPSVFKRNEEGNGGVIIDSGCSLTWLSGSAYEPLRDEVRSILDPSFRKPPVVGELDVCYLGKISQDLKGFPVVTFHFAGGADLVLDIESTFYKLTGSIFCMAIYPSSMNKKRDLSIVGINAQQNYNVAYDVLGKKLFFQRIVCELLDE